MMNETEKKAFAAPCSVAGNDNTNIGEGTGGGPEISGFLVIEKALFGCSITEFAAKLSGDQRLKGAWRLVQD
ncbi:MAG: hypothetical protein ACREAC_25630, partial [Blastocatellia bacterium]